MKLRTVMTAGGFTMAVIAVAAVVQLQGQRAQAATLTEGDAVRLAIQYAQRPSPGGRLLGNPTRANAQLTTLGGATLLKDGRALPPSTKLANEINRAVWLVFLRGDVSVVDLRGPGEPSGPSLTYNQASVVLDANTGEFLSMGFHPASHEVAEAATLPTVVLPEGPPAAEPPVLIRPTEQPLPTFEVGAGAPVTVPTRPAQPPIQVTPTPIQVTPTPVG